jgi:hypothetical protein
MSAVPNDFRSFPTAFSLAAGSSSDPAVKEDKPARALDLLYSIDQFTDELQGEDEALQFLWGDVSIAARHPAHIAA